MDTWNTPPGEVPQGKLSNSVDPLPEDKCPKCAEMEKAMENEPVIVLLVNALRRLDTEQMKSLADSLYERISHTPLPEDIDKWIEEEAKKQLFKNNPTIRNGDIMGIPERKELLMFYSGAKAVIEKFVKPLQFRIAELEEKLNLQKAYNLADKSNSIIISKTVVDRFTGRYKKLKEENQRLKGLVSKMYNEFIRAVENTSPAVSENNWRIFKKNNNL